MEFHGGGSGGIVVSGSNVPAFLTKLWTLVEDPETDPLICWSPNGTSFHVFDQGRFSKEVLPKFFKHNNMASFVRQLNMYGFRKVVHIEQGGLVKPEKDDTEFQHPFFIRGQDNLLENIKRKVTNITTLKQEELKISSDEVNKILTDVQHMKGKQENMDSKIIAMKHENAALWREVASLRQKHSQQQKVVNKLIHFLVTLVQSNRVLGMKRKIPLMLNDSSSAHSLPKFSRQYSLESSPAAISAPGATFSAASLYSADSPLTSGPVISDITDLAADIPIEVTSDWIQDRTSPLVLVKEEPTSPVVEEVCPPLEGSVTPVDTPLSPTTFFHSILQESSENNGNAPLCTPPSTPGPAPTTSDSAPQPEEQRCLSVACIDKTELHEHLEHIDNSLENLQSILNAQTINFDSSPLYEFFSNSLPSSDFDLDSLDTIQDLLSDSPRGPESSQNFNRSGKQLMQYAATPMLTTEPISADQGGADLPTLLELEGDTYFTTEDPPEEDPTISLLTSTFNDPNTQS